MIFFEKKGAENYRNIIPKLDSTIEIEGGIFN